MTPKQELQFETLLGKVEGMSKQLAEIGAQQTKVDRFLFVAPTTDQLCRAKQLDRVFTVHRGYKFTSRIGMAAIGFFLMIGTLIITYHSLIEKLKGGGNAL